METVVLQLTRLPRKLSRLPLVTKTSLVDTSSLSSIAVARLDHRGGPRVFTTPHGSESRELIEPFPTPPQTSTREGFRVGEAAVGAQGRLLRSGAQVLSDPELLSILCHAGRPDAATLLLARELLDEHGGLAGLMVAGPENLRQSGLGKDGLAVLLATRELACRLAQGQISGRAPLPRPAETARYLHLRYHLRDQEVFGALFLDLQRRLIADREIFRGTLARAAVEPREILKQALLCGAASVVLFHTHPSGNPDPSAEDLLFTRRMADAGEILGIELLDHLILGGGDRWVSLKERGPW